LTLKAEQRAGQLRIDLIKAGVAGTCEIDLKRGQAVLKYGSEQLGSPAEIEITPGRQHELLLANVDGRLTLRVDGHYVFGEGREYDTPTSSAPPTAEDLAPVRIASKDADVEVSSLVLKRDIHYTLDPAEADETALAETRNMGPYAFFDLISDPSRFDQLEGRGIRDYPISHGCYLMLGDNSPWSRDGRAWGRTDQVTGQTPERGWDNSGRASWEVPERLVVGKAFCVYWPCSTPVWPYLRLGADLVLPIRPTLEKIRWIR
jgi:signal peptidase I